MSAHRYETGPTSSASITRQAGGCTRTRRPPRASGSRPALLGNPSTANRRPHTANFRRRGSAPENPRPGATARMMASSTRSARRGVRAARCSRTARAAARSIARRARGGRLSARPRTVEGATRHRASVARSATETEGAVFLRARAARSDYARRHPGGLLDRRRRHIGCRPLRALDETKLRRLDLRRAVPERHELRWSRVCRSTRSSAPLLGGRRNPERRTCPMRALRESIEAVALAAAGAL